MALFAALVIWPRLAPPLELPPDVLPVELMTTADETNIAQQEKAPEPPPVPQDLPMPSLPQPAPPQFAELPPPPPPEDQAPALEPEPTPTPPPPPEKKIQPPQPRYAMLPTPRVKPKPEKPKEEFDINKITGVIDKMAKEPDQPRKQAPEAKAQAARSTQGAGAQTAMTMSELDALRAQLSKCWNVPVGAPDPSALVFRVKMFLNEDGTVASAPQLLDQGRMGDPYFRAAAESALRAVKICEPYNLPPEKYTTWAEITIEFDPRKMAGY